MFSLTSAIDKSRKIYIRTDTTTFTDEACALLGNADSKNEDNIEEALNVSNTKFCVVEETYEV